MHTRANPSIPLSLFTCGIFSLASIFFLPFNSLCQGTKLSRQQLRKAQIDSIFTRAEQQHLVTTGKLRYEFEFTETEQKRVNAFAERMQEDSFGVSSFVPSDKHLFYLRLYKNMTLTRAEMFDYEQKLRRLKYNYLIDDYLGFTIHPADPDPVSVKEADFIPFLKSLSDDQVYRVGEILLDNHQYDKALIAFQWAVQKKIYLDTTYYRYGQAFVGQNEFNKGINKWEDALEVNPKFLQVHLELGKIYFQNGYFEKALQHFHDADALHPNDEPILRQIAESLYALKLYNQSYVYAKRAQKLNRKDVFVRSLLDLLKEPRIKFLRKKFPEN